MLIKSKKYKTISKVYGLYWINDIVHILHFGNSKGLVVVCLDEFEIIDNTIENEFCFHNFSTEHSGIIHKALRDQRLLNNLFEHDVAAFEEFHRTVQKAQKP